MKGILLSAILLATAACDQKEEAKVSVKAWCRPEGGCDVTRIRCEFENKPCVPVVAAWRTKFYIGDAPMEIISSDPDTCKTAEETVKSMGHKFLSCEPL